MTAPFRVFAALYLIAGLLMPGLVFAKDAPTAAPAARPASKEPADVPADEIVEVGPAAPELSGRLRDWADAVPSS